MLEVRGLSVSYGQHRALENAGLRVGKGEIVVILGANGAGKSTLLKAAAGICEGRTSGSVVLDGEELVGQKPHRIVEAGFALVPEGRGVFGDLTVQENLTLGAYAQRARDEEAGNLDRIFTLFPKLEERRRQVVRTMSGGEQQMVAIGRAMMSNPSILGLDEPSLGLSPLLCGNLFQSLLAVKDAGLGVLLVEQNAKQSLKIADRGYLLENGEVVHEDTAEALTRDPAVQKAYLGGSGAKPSIAMPVAPKSGAKPNEPVRPRAGPSPKDIAAAALKGVATVRSKAPGVAPAPPPRPAPPAPLPKAAPPMSAPISPTAKSDPMDVSALVAKASASASRRNGSVRPAGQRPAVASAGPVPRTHVPLEPGTSGDRLRAILDDIEAAARRAEAWRGPERRS